MATRSRYRDEEREWRACAQWLADAFSAEGALPERPIPDNKWSRGQGNKRQGRHGRGRARPHRSTHTGKDQPDTVSGKPGFATSFAYRFPQPGIRPISQSFTPGNSGNLARQSGWKPLSQMESSLMSVAATTPGSVSLANAELRTRDVPEWTNA
jgi:hypothetical protein